MFKTFLTISFCITLVAGLTAQIPPSVPKNNPRYADQIGRDYNEVTIGYHTVSNAGGARPSEYRTRPVRADKVSKEIQNRLKVNDADLGSYREILKTLGTRVFKLLPMVDCPFTPLRDDSCARKRTGIMDNANSYSFQNGIHVAPMFGDIRLFDGNLDAWDNQMQTILTNLGDVPFENVNLNTEGVKYLSDFVPQPQLDEAIKQALQFAAGVKDRKFVYSKIVTPQVGDTIAMRSIVYSADGAVGPRGADVIVVMKVVKRDADGSLTIIWKELDRRLPPMVFYKTS